MKNFLLLTALLPFHGLFCQTPAFVRDSLENYIRQGMKDWQIPGLSIVIVKDGQVVWMKGYGVKDISSQEPVTPGTLFMIASNTKLFTATSLAQLDYDHRLSLDDPYTKYYPAFRLYDPGMTKLLSIRDLLSHRIGTVTFQGDFTFFNGNLSRAQIMDKMKLLKPSRPFRQDFGYCNSCFLAAGEIIPKVTGKPWEVYVQDSILSPLQMNSTYTSITRVPPGQTVAKPYTTAFTGTLRELPYDQWDNLGPAAALISSVSDLSHWLLFQLDSGRYQGRPVMSFDILQKTRDMNTVISSRLQARLPVHFTGYGLGIFQSDYNNHQIYWHTGGAFGMVSNVCFVPDTQLGIAILTNNDNQGFFEALRQQILDAYLGVDYHNRSLDYLPGSLKDMKENLSEIAGYRQRVKGETPPLGLSAYASHYTHPLYGSLDMSVMGSSLQVTYNGHAHLSASLQYMDHGDWLLTYDNIGFGIFKVRFKTSGNRVVSFDNRQNDFIEYGSYTFTRQ